LVEELFGRAIWTQTTLSQKAISISLLGITFCENDITTQEFEKITPYAISLL